MKRTFGFLLLLVSCVILSGCSLPKDAPKIIVADQTTYVACRGEVWVFTDNSFAGGTTYDVQFTQADGTEMDIRGIKHLEINDVPPDSMAKGICSGTPVQK